MRYLSQRRAFNEECTKLSFIFSRLDYPWSLIDSVISNFDSRNPSVSIAERNTDESKIVRINLLFKDQNSANAVRRQLGDLSNKIGPTLQPVLVSKKLEQDLKPIKKPSRQLSTNNTFTISYVICAMQIMSAT